MRHSEVSFVGVNFIDWSVTKTQKKMQTWVDGTSPSEASLDTDSDSSSDSLNQTTAGKIKRVLSKFVIGNEKSHVIADDRSLVVLSRSLAGTFLRG